MKLGLIKLKTGKLKSSKTGKQKEGNITWFSNNNNNLPQVVNNPNRQAGAPLPPGEGINTPQQDLSLLLRKEKVLTSQAQLPSQEESNSQAIAHLPFQEGSNSPLAGGPPGSSTWGRQQFYYSSPSH